MQTRTVEYRLTRELKPVPQAIAGIRSLDTLMENVAKHLREEWIEGYSDKIKIEEDREEVCVDHKHQLRSVGPHHFPSFFINPRDWVFLVATQQCWGFKYPSNQSREYDLTIHEQRSEKLSIQTAFTYLWLHDLTKWIVDTLKFRVIT